MFELQFTSNVTDNQYILGVHVYTYTQFNDHLNVHYLAYYVYYIDALMKSLVYLFTDKLGHCSSSILPCIKHCICVVHELSYTGYRLQHKIYSWIDVVDRFLNYWLRIEISCCREISILSEKCIVISKYLV